jgi:serine/threonine protein phosphatase PrpC
VAEEIGVCAEPEVEIRNITADNPFLVIASDGVFEFLTDQNVVNMVCPLPSPTALWYTQASDIELAFQE